MGEARCRAFSQATCTPVLMLRAECSLFTSKPARSSPYLPVVAALQGIRSRLDTLASINAENILIPGGPQEHYHQIVEEAYAALGLIETQVDTLRAELEYQHQRLDEARDAAFAEATQLGIEREDNPA